MFNKNVFKQTIKSNCKLWMIITGVLVFFISLFTIVIGRALPDMLSKMPGAAIMMPDAGKSMLQFIGTMFCGSIGFLLPLVYILSTGNSLIASQVDRGSMAYTLSTPISRKEVTFTQIIYFILAVVGMYSLITIACIIGIKVAGLEIYFKELMLLFVGLVLLQLAIAGISFMFSCIFNTSGKSITFGAGIPIMSYIFSLVATAGSSYSDFFKFFEYISLNSLYRPTDIMALDASIIVPCFVALAFISIATFTTGHFVFKKKDLPL